MCYELHANRPELYFLEIVAKDAVKQNHFYFFGESFNIIIFCSCMFAIKLSIIRKNSNDV